MNTSRLVLSEIPERVEQLSLNTLPTTHSFDEEPTPGNNLTMLYNSSSLPSPDEIVIRQRGRRRITLSFSPEKCPARSPFQKTPTKNFGNQTTMILRSSPRKRNINDTISSEKSSEKFNLNNNGQVGQLTNTPVIKRVRLDKPLQEQITTEIPLHLQLKGLSQNQLIEIIQNLIKEDQKIENKIRNKLPMPDISLMEAELMSIKRNIFKSLPTSRLCKKTDSTSFAKASTHLTAFKKSIVTNSKILHESGHWNILLDFVKIAWNYVRATPIWDNNSQNVVRRHCFKILSCNCLVAIKLGGKQLSTQRIYDLERDLKEWSKDWNDILSGTGHLKKLLNDIITKN